MISATRINKRVVVGSTLLSTCCWSQHLDPVAGSAPAEKQSQTLESFDSFSQQQRRMMQGQMELQIDAIGRVCQLSSRQQDRLRKGARETVDHCMDKWRRQMKRIEQLMVTDRQEELELLTGQDKTGLGNQFVHAIRSIVSIEAVVEVLQAVPPVLFQMLGKFDSNLDTLSPAEQPQWKLAVKQKKAYDQAITTRHQYHRKPTVHSLIAHIDHHIMLSDRQRIQMTVLIEAAVDKPVLEVNFGENHSNEMFALQLITRSQLQ
ncbi:MAG: hypothetical protein N2C12_13670, partial [Planctomycetales bacterium]